MMGRRFPKHVEFYDRINIWIISASGRLFKKKSTTMQQHGNMNKKYSPVSRITPMCTLKLYRVIYKSIRDFRPLRYSSRDGHAEGEHVNRGRGTPSFCPTLQVLDMCTLGDAADFNPVIKFLRHALQRVSQELDFMEPESSLPYSQVSANCP
jgi:hypothetical protein